MMMDCKAFTAIPNFLDVEGWKLLFIIIMGRRLVLQEDWYCRKTGHLSAGISCFSIISSFQER